MDRGETTPTTVTHVVALPYPGRGHINPMMNLCKSLISVSSRILITFIVTEEWFGFLNGSAPTDNRIHLTSIPNVLPSELNRSADFAGFIEAVMTKMEAPFEQLLDRLEPPPCAIIADTFLAWTVRVGNRRKIPVASFWPMSAATFSAFQHFHLLEQNGHFPVDVSERGNERVDYIPGLSSTMLVEILGTSGGRYDSPLDRFLDAFRWAPKAQYLLFTSLYELEQATINVLKPEFSFPVYTIGPAIPNYELQNDDFHFEKPDYVQWLDGKSINSVLYISLGSFLSVSSTQMDEILAGLCEIGVSFMLVGRTETNRLKEACGDRGFVVQWCNQLRVLSHDSVGGFLSHCGWNSTKEGLFSGVPFLTFPIAADQFMNSKLIADDWKIGWRVKKDLTNECLVAREEIAGLVRKFMDPQEDEVKEMRRRAKELQEMFQRGTAANGSAETDIISFLNDISS